MTQFIFRATVTYDDADWFGSTDGTIGTAALLRKLADLLEIGGEGPFVVAGQEGVTASGDYEYGEG